MRSPPKTKYTGELSQIRREMFLAVGRSRIVRLEPWNPMFWLGTVWFITYLGVEAESQSVNTNYPERTLKSFPGSLGINLLNHPLMVSYPEL